MILKHRWMHRTLARCLRGVADRLDPRVIVDTRAIVQVFNAQSTPDDVVRKLRFYVESDRA